MTQSTAAMLAGWKPGELRDVHADMMTLTLEIVAKSLFGSDVSEDARGIAHTMTVVMELFTTQANWAFVLPDRIPIPKSKRLRQSIKHLNDVVYKLIRDRRKAPSGDDPTAGSDLLTNLLAVKDEDGGR
jgi:cytochrome P450